MVDRREAAARVLRRCFRARRRIAIVVIASLCLVMVFVTALLVLRARSRDAVWAEVTASHRDARLRDRILVGSGFGPDVTFIDRALAHAFDRFPIDPQRIAVVGFSDGASYALSLGLANGDLFHKIVAFSPGGVAGDAFVGTPDVFVSHGRSDEVLRIDECSRVVVPQLSGSGYDVTYEEFDGGHTMPPDTFARAMAWLGN